MLSKQLLEKDGLFNKNDANSKRKPNCYCF